MSIGYNIRRLREAHGMNQSEFASIAGVSDKAVSTWENNQKTPRMGAIQKIADYFRIPKSAIIEDDYEIKEPPAPVGAEDDNLIDAFEEALVPILVSLGFIRSADDLSDKDLRFLSAVFSLMDAHFSRDP